MRSIFGEDPGDFAEIVLRLLLVHMREHRVSDHQRVLPGLN